MRQDARPVPDRRSEGDPDGQGGHLDGFRELERRRQRAHEGGGRARKERQHDRGKLTARERVKLLVDPDSWIETDALREPRDPEIGDTKAAPGDGVVTGSAEVDGTPVAVYAQDFTVQGGSLGRSHASKIAKTLDQAIRQRCPVIGFNDSGGARIQEGVASLAGYGDIFQRNVEASGLVPQITVVAGPCAGGAVYSPALTDFVILVRGSGRMFLTGPDVVETVTGEDVTSEELGGASVHGSESGVAHFVADDEQEAIAQARRLLDYLPRSTEHELPTRDGPEAEPTTEPVLDGVIPDQREKPYDIDEVTRRIVDGGRTLEVMQDFAPNIRTSFARLGGTPVGVVANDPAHLAGVLDLDASTKAARFVRTCDAFGLPVVSLVDVPGFMPGTEQEHNGVIRHGAKLVHAYAEADVPTITCVLRKAYGGAYIAMNSQHLGCDVNLAWPTAEIAVMGPDGAVRVLHRDKLAEADDTEAVREQLRQEFEDAFADPYQAAREGYVDEVVEPRHTRHRMITWLDRLSEAGHEPSSKPHGNTPL
jgi:acetyl-CoA carboxylase carboxyltransferase component